MPPARRADRRAARPNPFSGAGAWISGHTRLCLLALVAVGLGLRVLLATHCPVSLGYVYDDCQQPVEYLVTRGHLPASDRYWQAYHPPLFFLVGAAFHRAGRVISHPTAALAVLSLLCGLAVAWYSYRILSLYRQRGPYLVLGTALILALPVLFISSWGIDVDIMLAALMTAFLYHLLRHHRARYRSRWREPLALGMLAGLAAATKFSGLIALLVYGVVTVARVAAGPRRLSAVRDGLLVLALTVSIGGWKYYDNYVRHGNPLYANAEAVKGFALGDRQYRWDRYDFLSLRLGDALGLMAPGAPHGMLTNFPVYHSVWTSLHAQTWGDMSFFSEPTRHGTGKALYPGRGIPLWLPTAVLWLAFVPGALALVGLGVTLRRRTWWPLALFLAVTLAVYFSWMLTQESWGVKAKYVLFLLPVYVLYVLAGLRWVGRALPPAATYALACALAALLVAANLYLYRFAVGA